MEKSLGQKKESGKRAGKVKESRKRIGDYSPR